MNTSPNTDRKDALSALRWPLRLTWAGMLAEGLVQALWPLLSVTLLVLAALMMGLQDVVSLEVVWGAAVVAGLGWLAALVHALRRFRLPSLGAAMARLDRSLPGRPIQALLDDPAIGKSDPAAMAVWRAHKARMAARTATARAVPADLRVSRRDPYALRYVAVLAFGMALLFGSVLRVASVADMAPGRGGLAQGPVWEGWAEPPRYTGKPTLYLNDLDAGPLTLPAGTLITLRFYGDVGALTLAETVSGRTTDVPAASDPAQDFAVVQDGSIAIDGPGGRRWDVTMLADTAPEVEQLGPPEVSALGEMRLPFAARDDYGVEAGEARITLDLASVTRRYGLVVDPDPRPEVIVPLPTPIAGNRADFEENLIEDFSKHPWANLPVQISMSVLDSAEQIGQTAPRQMTLPGRRFFDPAAAAVIEMRRDLLWSKSNTTRMAQVLRAVAYRPGDLFRSEVTALRLRDVINRLELHARYGLSDEIQDELAEDLWGLAIELEEGVLADALDRMRRAQDRLNEAMKNGASDEEIAELMDELRRATEDYLQQLQRQQAQENEQNGDPQQQGEQGESMQMTQDDLQRMMDRIQELMEQGRMAEAEQALRELQEMMENMRVTQGQPGEGGNSPGEQAMEGLSETLREQQGLSDQAFRDLRNSSTPVRRLVKIRATRAAMAAKGAVRATKARTVRVRARISSRARTASAANRPDRARARRGWRNVSRRCARNCAASSRTCRVRARPRAARRVMRWTGRAGPWTVPKRRCATMIWPRPSTIRRKPWKRCAKGCGHSARRWRNRNVSSSPDRATPNRAVAPTVTRWAARAKAPRADCRTAAASARGRMPVTVPAVCWMKSAAAPARQSAPNWNVTISTGCLTGSDAGSDGARA